MANKKGSKGLPFAVRIALSAAVKKNTKSKEEYETVMAALESLDLNTLFYDPEALARVMANPSGELRNYVKEGVALGDEGAEATDDADGAALDTPDDEADIAADGATSENVTDASDADAPAEQESV